MAEDRETPEHAHADPAAIALSGADREEANAFLRKQGKLADLQIEEMRERNPYERSHLRLRRFSGWARAALELSAGVVALVIVAGFGLMAWNAAHADGLVVEAFSVPPAFVEAGVGGEVLADDISSKLAVIRDTDSSTGRDAT